LRSFLFNTFLGCRRSFSLEYTPYPDRSIGIEGFYLH